MSRLRLMLVGALALTVLTAGAATAAAPSSTVQLVDGRTTLLVDPATMSVLRENKIVAMPVAPASAKNVWKRGLTRKFAFPVTGGMADPATLAGEIRHSGGIRFVNMANGKALMLTDFTIDTVAGQLTAAVNGDPNVRVPILNLDLSQADVRVKPRWIKVRGVGASLTSTAAGALNASLGVSFFAEGIRLGTADVMAKIAGKRHHQNGDDNGNDVEHDT